MSDLETELKHLIIESLELEDVSVDDIDSEEQLFGGSLGLDSIDALELGVIIQKKYNIPIKDDSDEEMSYFKTISSLATFINQHVNQ
jgi:acyl carrier protein